MLEGRAIRLVILTCLVSVCTGQSSRDEDLWSDQQRSSQPRKPASSSRSVDELEELRGSIPGEPGRDYPIYAVAPETKFNCDGRGSGYFADTEAGCQVYHYCDGIGRHYSNLCPNGTIFNQKTFVCQWWYNVQCDDSDTFFVLNENLYRMEARSLYDGFESLWQNEQPINKQRTLDRPTFKPLVTERPRKPPPVTRPPKTTPAPKRPESQRPRIVDNGRRGASQTERSTQYREEERTPSSPVRETTSSWRSYEDNHSNNRDSIRPWQPDSKFLTTVGPGYEYQPPTRDREKIVMRSRDDTGDRRPSLVFIGTQQETSEGEAANDDRLRYVELRNQPNDDGISRKVKRTDVSTTTARSTTSAEEEREKIVSLRRTIEERLRKAAEAISGKTLTTADPKRKFDEQYRLKKHRAATEDLLKTIALMKKFNDDEARRLIKAEIPAPDVPNELPELPLVTTFRPTWTTGGFLPNHGSSSSFPSKIHPIINSVNHPHRPSPTQRSKPHSQPGYDTNKKTFHWPHKGGTESSWRPVRVLSRSRREDENDSKPSNDDAVITVVDVPWTDIAEKEKEAVLVNVSEPSTEVVPTTTTTATIKKIKKKVVLTNDDKKALAEYYYENDAEPGFWDDDNDVGDWDWARSSDQNS